MREKAIGSCAWFLLCDNVAVGTVQHPVLGAVPVCERCATKHSLPLTPYEVRPTCDICGRDMEDSPNVMPYEADWNGETGNHLFCEEARTT